MAPGGELKVTANHRTFTAACLVLSVAALYFGGCTQSDNITPAAETVPAAAPGDPHICYQRSGGLSGLEDTLLIYTGGDCDLYRKNGARYSCPVFPLKLEKLEEAFLKADFLAMPAEYPGNSQADAIRYVIDYTANGDTHRVTAWSNAMPDRLLPLVRELDQCVMLISIAGVRP